jgi:hypothetical protein
MYFNTHFKFTLTLTLKYKGLCQVTSRKYLENMYRNNNGNNNGDNDKRISSNRNDFKSNTFNNALNNLDYCPEISNANISNISQSLRDYYCHQIETVYMNIYI